MRCGAFNWVDFDDRSSLRYNFRVVAWVVCRNGRWTVEIFHWRGEMGGRVASRAQGKRFLARWADAAGMWWIPAERKRR